jgi:hypothetical protein
VVRPGDRRFSRTSASYKSCAIIVGSALAIYCSPSHKDSTPPQERSPIASINASAPALTGTELFARLSPSVFVLLAKNTTSEVIALGTGVAIGDDEIVTNSHVISTAVTLELVQSGRTWRAFVKQDRPDLDLALLTVPGLRAQPVAMRAVDRVRTGEKVYAVGNPRGLEATISEGVVSSIRQTREGPIIQTTAPISPGSSGGGLFDASGLLIGITTSYLRDSQNLNFAIPTDVVRKLVESAAPTNSSALVLRPQGGETVASSTPLDGGRPITELLGRLSPSDRRRVDQLIDEVIRDPTHVRPSLMPEFWEILDKIGPMSPAEVRTLRSAAGQRRAYFRLVLEDAIESYSSRRVIASERRQEAERRMITLGIVTPQRIEEDRAFVTKVAQRQPVEFHGMTVVFDDKTLAILIGMFDSVDFSLDALFRREH